MATNKDPDTDAYKGAQYCLRGRDAARPSHAGSRSSDQRDIDVAPGVGVQSSHHFPLHCGLVLTRQSIAQEGPGTVFLL